MLASNEPSFDESVRFFCRHLVSFAGWYYPIDAQGKQIGEMRSFSYSGFIFSIRGLWCLATAGHILEDLEQHLQEDSIKVIQYLLVDNFGPNAKSNDPIPFDYVRAPKFFVHNKVAGLDFGLVGLSYYYQQLLQANSIVPVSEENWIHQHEVEFGEYMILGLPKQFITTEKIRSGEKIMLASNVSPTIIHVSRLKNTPNDLPITTLPRFIGKISDNLSLENIDGMSGGPIIGFNKKGDKYWIVAIQSSWIKQRKIVFGCPLPIFAQIVEDMAKEKG